MTKLNRFQLLIRRSNKHFYVQIVDPSGKIVTAVTSRDKELKGQDVSLSSLANTMTPLVRKKIESLEIGSNLMLRCKPHRYSGMIKAFAENLRSSGVKI